MRGVGNGRVGRLRIGIGGWRGPSDGVRRALPCVAYRAIMGGGSDARRGWMARGVTVASESTGEVGTMSGVEEREGVAFGERRLREGRDCARDCALVVSSVINGFRGVDGLTFRDTLGEEGEGDVSSSGGGELVNARSVNEGVFEKVASTEEDTAMCSVALWKVLCTNR